MYSGKGPVAHEIFSSEKKKQKENKEESKTKRGARVRSCELVSQREREWVEKRIEAGREIKKSESIVYVQRGRSSRFTS